MKRGRGGELYHWIYIYRPSSRGHNQSAWQAFEGQEKKDSGRVRSAKGVRGRRKGNIFFPPDECKNPDWSVIRTCQSAPLIP